MTEEKKNVTLAGYLQVVRDLEDGLIELNPEELGIVFNGLKDKIDGYVELSQYMKDRASALKARGQALIQQAKYLENSEKRLKQYLAMLLQNNETPEINGTMWKVALTKSKKVIVEKEANEENAGIYPELMRQKVTYEWDKTAIKQRLRNVCDSPSWLRLEETYSIKSRVNK